MTTTSSQDRLAWLHEQLAESHSDVPQALLEKFVEQPVSADIDAVRGADYRQSSPGVRAPARTATGDSHRARGSVPSSSPSPSSARAPTSLSGALKPSKV